MQTSRCDKCDKVLHTSCVQITAGTQGSRRGLWDRKAPAHLRTRAGAWLAVGGAWLAVGGRGSRREGRGSRREGRVGAGPLPAQGR